MKVRIVNQSKYSLPEYKTSLSAGMDLQANIDAEVVLQALERKLIPTGLFIELKHGISVLNTPGTIDADYRGEIGVIVVNLSQQAYTIQPGERICQMIISKHEQVMWEPTEILQETERGAGGFGHTGRK